jgi:hypothetical protein
MLIIYIDLHWMCYANMFSNIWNLFIVFCFYYIAQTQISKFYTKLEVWKYLLAFCELDLHFWLYVNGGE